MADDDLTIDGQLLLSIWCALTKLGEATTTGFPTFAAAAAGAQAVADRLGDASDPELRRASRWVALGAYSLQLAGERPGQSLRSELTGEALADFETARAMLAAPRKRSA